VWSAVLLRLYLCAMLSLMRVFSSQKSSCSPKSFRRPTSIPFDYVLN
jgi:hypothetical protein